MRDGREGGPGRHHPAAAAHHAQPAGDGAAHLRPPVHQPRVPQGRWPGAGLRGQAVSAGAVPVLACQHSGPRPRAPPHCRVSQSWLVAARGRVRFVPRSLSGPPSGATSRAKTILLSPLPSPAWPALAPASFPQAGPRHPRVACCQLGDLARVTSRPVGTVTGPAQHGRGVTQVEPLLLGVRCRLQSPTQALGRYLPSLCHRHDPHGRRPWCPCHTRLV